MSEQQYHLVMVDTNLYVRCVYWTSRKISYTNDPRMAWHGTTNEAYAIHGTIFRSTKAINVVPEAPGVSDARALLSRAFRLLATSQCEELCDYTFGDTEMFWIKDGTEVATGYFGSSENTRSITFASGLSVEGDAAIFGRKLYASIKSVRNDCQSTYD